MKFNAGSGLLTLIGIFSAIILSTSKSQAFDPDVFEPARYSSDEIDLVYRLYSPDDYSSEKKYPIILFLHGSGERGDDNILQIKHNFPNLFIKSEWQSENPCFMVAPQCPKGASWSEKTLSGVKGILDSLSDTLPIDKNRIYVTGVSMGGRGVFNILTQYPEMFAAAVPCAGGSDPSMATKLKRTPMWMHCASKDRSIDHYYNMVTALKEQGQDVVWFKSKRNRSAPNMPWESIEKHVKTGTSYLFCEILEGGHPDSWNFAWENPQMPIWLFSKKRKN